MDLHLAGKKPFSSLAIDLDQPGHLDLFRRAHDEIYDISFPDSNQRDEFSFWLDHLNRRDGPCGDYIAVVTGDNLREPANSNVQGISIGVYYNQVKTGFLAYHAVHPDARGQGIGRPLFESLRSVFRERAAHDKGRLRAVFSDINDPAKVSRQDDVFDPAKRVAIFEKWGARRVPIDYVQPALASDKGKGENMLLLSYPDDNGYFPSPDLIASFLRAMYAGYGLEDPVDDDDYSNMMAQLGQAGYQPKVA